MRTIEWEQQEQKIEQSQEADQLLIDADQLAANLLETINAWTLPPGYDPTLGVHPMAIEQTAYDLFLRWGNCPEFAATLLAILSRSTYKLQRMYVWQQGLDQEETNYVTENLRYQRAILFAEFMTRRKILQYAYAYKTSGLNPTHPSQANDFLGDTSVAFDFSGNLDYAGDFTSLIE